MKLNGGLFDYSQLFLADLQLFTVDVQRSVKNLFVKVKSSVYIFFLNDRKSEMYYI